MAKPMPKPEEAMPIMQATEDGAVATASPPAQGAMSTGVLSHMEDTPAYSALLQGGLLTSKYRKTKFDDIFTGADLKANSSKANDVMERVKSCWCVPGLGCVLYGATHTEMFVPAGHVGLLVDGENRYYFAQPGMHNIKSCWIKHAGVKKLPVNSQLQHGNRVILVVEQGFVGVAFDSGQPVLFPPGLHVWMSETLQYQEAVALDASVVKLGPYTLLTVDEGYAAVTQNNGKQSILMGGHTWLLTHKNWRFTKFLTLKIQTDELQQIHATSADNITMRVSSTVTWRIKDPLLAASMAAETMAQQRKEPPKSGGKDAGKGAGMDAGKDAGTDAGQELGKATAAQIPKLRNDVLKQAIASLAGFMGGVNYSDSFHMAAAAAQQSRKAREDESPDEPEAEGMGRALDNPLYDTARMLGSVAHANETTNSYGVEILSINILSAVPVDSELTKALACGAVASAQALQAETAARGNAKATRIVAEATAQKARIAAEGEAQAAIVQARAQAESARLVAEGNKKSADLLSTSQVAVDLAKIDKSAKIVGKSDKFFFGQEPAYLANLVLKGSGAPGGKGMFG